MVYSILSLNELLKQLCTARSGERHNFINVVGRAGESRLFRCKEGAGGREWSLPTRRRQLFWLGCSQPNPLGVDWSGIDVVLTSSSTQKPQVAVSRLEVGTQATRRCGGATASSYLHLFCSEDFFSKFKETITTCYLKIASFRQPAVASKATPRCFFASIDFVSFPFFPSIFLVPPRANLWLEVVSRVSSPCLSQRKSRNSDDNHVLCPEARRRRGPPHRRRQADCSIATADRNTLTMTAAVANEAGKMWEEGKRKGT